MLHLLQSNEAKGARALAQKANTKQGVSLFKHTIALYDRVFWRFFLNIYYHFLLLKNAKLIVSPVSGQHKKKHFYLL